MTTKNDVIIGKIRTSESFITFLGRVTDVKANVITGIHEKDCHLPNKRKEFEIVAKDLVLNLGPNPYPGVVHKFDVSHLYTGHRKIHDFFGDIHFFYKPEKAIGKLLMEAFDKAQSILERLKMPAPEQTYWEVNCKEAKAGGKYSGYFKPSRDPEKQPHVFSIKPESMPPTLRTFVYVIIHEYAHWFHHVYLTSLKANAAWIKLFNTSIKPQTIDKELSKDLLKRLVEGSEAPRDFRGQLEEEERNAFNWILRTISQEHAVGLRELNILFEAEQKEQIEKLWPKRTLLKKDLKPVVSEYACKNYHELWAEAFSLHYAKVQKVPPQIVELMERHIQQALRTHGGN